MSVNAPNKELNWKAHNFKLLSVDDKYYTLDDLKGNNGTVIAFICNHCPYVIKIAKSLAYEAEQLRNIGISTIAIMPNDVEEYPLDSFENMKLFKKKFKFNFQYLYDDTQETAKNYKVVCTPDIYGFNRNLVLKYRGRIDSSSVLNKKNNIIKRDLFHAMEQIYKTNEGPEKQFNSFGCSIKWK